ncbi:hypothetical protein ACFWHT_10780 [Microbacterium sp. NPDC058342]|uniref:hypothetical protein n=1 Tax=Microbacterium sp. NPDC058342 TaxID=3346454 RepID=UPI003658377B
MSEDIFAADPNALRSSSRRIAALKGRVQELARGVNDIMVGYPNAAGDGSYREAFDKKYVPSATESHRYTQELAEAVQDFGKDMSDVAVVVDDADGDATANASRR